MSKSEGNFSHQSYFHIIIFRLHFLLVMRFFIKLMYALINLTKKNIYIYINKQEI
jgi:hypothetical protein